MIRSKVLRFVSVGALVLFGVLALGTGGCNAHASGASGAVPIEVDEAEVVAGVADNGRDPAVLALVAVDSGSDALCTATLIAPDVVLTARHCVSLTVDSVVCPPTGSQVLGERPPSSLRVLVGDDVSTAREAASGVSVVVPPGDALCDADIALVLLDRPVDGIAPLDVSETPVLAGGHVVAIGFGRPAAGEPPGTRLLREHVEVLSVSSAEFLVGEATCQGDSGGPALNETTGAIVGVVSRGGPTCEGSGVHNVYTRPDIFLPLVARALALSAWALAPRMADGGLEAQDAAGAAKAPRQSPDAGTYKPPSDMGDPCATAAGCGTGVCVLEGSNGYCSRSCGTADRCPDHYHCTLTGPAEKVCVQAT